MVVEVTPAKPMVLVGGDENVEEIAEWGGTSANKSTYGGSKAVVRTAIVLVARGCKMRVRC